MNPLATALDSFRVIQAIAMEDIDSRIRQCEEELLTLKTLRAVKEVLARREPEGEPASYRSAVDIDRDSERATKPAPKSGKPLHEMTLTEPRIRMINLLASRGPLRTAEISMHTGQAAANVSMLLNTASPNMFYKEGALWHVRPEAVKLIDRDQYSEPVKGDAAP